MPLNKSDNLAGMKEVMIESEVVLQYFDGGDAWYTPAAKILIDQSLFAASWNALYYVMLGNASQLNINTLGLCASCSN